MSSARDIRRRIRCFAPQVISVCVMVYFLYHAIQGDRGFLAWLSLSQELDRARVAAEVAAADRARIEDRIGRLKLDNLDTDLLEERARVLLNLARPDEIVVHLPQRSD